MTFAEQIRTLEAELASAHAEIATLRAELNAAKPSKQNDATTHSQSLTERCLAAARSTNKHQA